MMFSNEEISSHSKMWLEENANVSAECPFKGSIISSSISSTGKYQESSKHVAALKKYPHAITIGELTIESKIPPSARLMTLFEGLNVPGDTGNPPEPPPWFDRELFDRGREFYRKYIFCLSFCDLLALVFMLSNNTALNPLIYTNQSDTPLKALKRYFSTLLHIVTWYKGDVWDPEDQAHKDIMAIRSVHGKIARLVNSSEENEKVSNINVSDKGHIEPTQPLYTSIQQDIIPYVEARITVKNPLHFISQLDMSLTQYTFMGLLVAHPKKLGAGAASEEEFAGLIHFWRGIGWLLGIDDKYNFCSGSVAETRALCLEVERLIGIPFLAESGWNYEHMSTSLMSGMQMIIPNLSYPTMFRFLAHTLNLAVPSFVKRMSFRHCFHYWVMRIIFGLLVFFPSFVEVLSSRFSHMISLVENRSGRFGKCPNGAALLRKNYA